ncbi:MAG: HAMP domain-containing histidine kinase [Clostridiales bacterium]|jgi:signal transduction histidine kinase|nr:HAMP domain-containing histidine kinase [Clostridiales bacterium]
MAERIYIENLHQRIDDPSGDAAVRQLVYTINTMIERLEKEVRKQVFFISDASHEMRTPIAVIKGYIDLLNRWGKNDPKVIQEAINAIKLETERMSSLITMLLSLVRSGDAANGSKLQMTSLNAAARTVLRELEVLNNDGLAALSEESDEYVLGNSEMIMQMIHIFIDNGLKYAKANSEPMQIIISGDENGSYLTVKDSGIGIHEDDLPYIFERFYRADKSRSGHMPGFGLGLAIADAISRVHDATIAVHSELGIGTEFTVRFPKPLRTEE